MRKRSQWHTFLQLWSSSNREFASSLTFHGEIRLSIYAYGHEQPRCGGPPTAGDLDDCVLFGIVDLRLNPAVPYNPNLDTPGSLNMRARG